MHCKSCSKIIDDDSIFCKYCGIHVTTGKKAAVDNVKLKDIFHRVYSTLHSNSQYTKDEFDNEFDYYKSYENRVISNNDYFMLLVDVIFYSGFKASTVDKYLSVIHSYFNDYRKVAKFNRDQI